MGNGLFNRSSDLAPELSMIPISPGSFLQLEIRNTIVLGTRGFQTSWYHTQILWRTGPNPPQISMRHVLYRNYVGGPEGAAEEIDGSLSLRYRGLTNLSHPRYFSLSKGVKVAALDFSLTSSRCMIQFRFSSSPPPRSDHFLCLCGERPTFGRSEADDVL